MRVEAGAEFRPRGSYRRLDGQRFGRLVAVRPVSIATDGHVEWQCQCDCGKQAVVPQNSLRVNVGGGTKSCGCLRTAAAHRRLTQGGPWNEGKSYSINGGTRCYKTRHGWAKAVIKAKGNRCSRCGWDRARCDVHHIVPKAKGGAHTIANGEVVCPNCHRQEHG